MLAMRSAVKLGCCAFLVGVACPAGAWGPTGHRVVGTIAESQLCPETREYLAPLLDGASLANAGVWADTIRNDPRWSYTRPWHFINVGDTESLARATRNPGGNVLTAIDHSERELADSTLSRERRATALRFFVHFVADVHQPLHVGRQEDHGGNDLQVRTGRNVRNLHALWDGEWLLSWDGLDLTDNARAIGALATTEASRWQGEDTLQWAEESRVFRRLVYDLPPADGAGPVRLDDRYLAAARNVVNLRLAQAGVRLAERLNRLGCPPPKNARSGALSR
jgi:hypothetical protein